MVEQAADDISDKERQLEYEIQNDFEEGPVAVAAKMIELGDRKSVKTYMFQMPQGGLFGSALGRSSNDCGFKPDVETLYSGPMPRESLIL